MNNEYSHRSRFAKAAVLALPVLLLFVVLRSIALPHVPTREEHIVAPITCIITTDKSSYRLGEVPRLQIRLINSSNL
ncbi:MAG TPA: hypothetical protein VNA16_02045, partial [Abditibacteriaceae bacterium]|nr:hypothetical protein [Abditibacteriaceae bacterium]